jgi:hypothetical protein
MVDIGEKNTRNGPKLALLPGSLILSYQVPEEENLDQKSPGPPGSGLMQRTSSSLITKKQKKNMLKYQTPSLEKQTEIIHSFISIQPLGLFSRNQNTFSRPVWLWHTVSWASS